LLWRLWFDAVVLQALKETEQALSTYGAELDRRQALSEAQERAHRVFDIAHDQVMAGAASSVDLLAAEQSLVSADAAVAASDAALVQDQIAVFKALGGGWRTGFWTFRSRFGENCLAGCKRRLRSN
jgi:outer membrane protein TolC